jgi:hypothetical protein
LLGLLGSLSLLSYTAHGHKWNLFVISSPSPVIPNNVRNPVFLLRINSARNLSVRSGQAPGKIFILALRLLTEFTPNV